MKLPVQEIKFGNYLIRTNGLRAFAFHTKDKDRKGQFDGIDPLKKAIEWCRGIKRVS